MEEWIGGSPYETPDERPIMQKRINEFIQKSFHKDIKFFTEQDIFKSMNRAVRALKKVNLIETRSKIEFNKYRITSYPAFLWQEKYVASFYFFATMLGYVDKKIDIEQKNMEFNSHFLFADTSKEHPHKDEMDKSNSKIQEYCLVRKEIIDGYKTIIGGENSHSNIVLKTLETLPSYDNFDSLYKDHKDCSTQLYLSQQLINAYNLGYIFNKSSYEEVVNKYRQLFSELLAEKEYNESIVSNPKRKILSKKFLY